MTLGWNVVVAEAVRQGWREERRTRHLILWAPSGRGHVCISTSPSDREAIHKCLADLRRLGFSWQGRHTPCRPRPQAALTAGEPELDDPWRAALDVDEAVYTAIVEAARPLTTTEVSELAGHSHTAVRPALDALVEADCIACRGWDPRPGRGPDRLYALTAGAGDVAA